MDTSSPGAKIELSLFPAPTFPFSNASYCHESTNVAFPTAPSKRQVTAHSYITGTAKRDTTRQTNSYTFAGQSLLKDNHLLRFPYANHYAD